MKLEKINDNQIRCILSKADLADRQLKLSELAYGTEKAKNLFRDMMSQASYEFGFEAEDIPLMIEAIPLSGEGIVLIITKVEDPDELDARFSNFGPVVNNDEEYDEDYDEDLEDDENENDNEDEFLRKVRQDFIDILSNAFGQSGLEDGEEAMDMIKKALKEGKPKAISDAKNEKDKISEEELLDKTTTLEFFFITSSIDNLIEFSSVLSRYRRGSGRLYKDPRTDEYVLRFNWLDKTRELRKFVNMAREYGNVEPAQSSRIKYLEEHGSVIIESDAVMTLATDKKEAAH